MKRKVTRAGFAITLRLADVEWRATTIMEAEIEGGRHDEGMTSKSASALGPTHPELIEQEIVVDLDTLTLHDFDISWEREPTYRKIAEGTLAISVNGTPCPLRPSMWLDGFGLSVDCLPVLPRHVAQRIHRELSERLPAFAPQWSKWGRFQPRFELSRPHVLEAVRRKLSRPGFAITLRFGPAADTA